MPGVSNNLGCSFNISLIDNWGFSLIHAARLTDVFFMYSFTLLGGSTWCFNHSTMPLYSSSLIIHSEKGKTYHTVNFIFLFAILCFLMSLSLDLYAGT